MAKLSYWCAENLNDNSDSIIDKTKRGAQTRKDALPHVYMPVKKHTIVYTDAFHLLELVTAPGAGRGYSNG